MILIALNIISKLGRMQLTSHICYTCITKSYYPLVLAGTNTCKWMPPTLTCCQLSQTNNVGADDQLNVDIRLLVLIAPYLLVSRYKFPEI